MKLNKNLITIVGVLICVFGLAFSTNAQKRRTTGKKTKTSTSATSALATTAEVKAGAEKVSTQIKNVSKFIYNLGSIAQVTEDLFREIAAKRASAKAPDLYEKNKLAIVSSIRGIRDGLAALEVEFRTKPSLRIYLIHIQGMTDAAGRAEDQASTGQLIESGKTLLLVVEKLSDTLAAMP